MNTRTARLLIPILGLGLITLPGLKAQDQGSTNTSTNSAPTEGPGHGGWKHREGGLLASLTDEERQELRTASEQIKDSPELKAAHEAVKQAMENLKQTRNQLLLKADANIQPILDKIEANKPKGPRGEHGPGHGPGPEGN